MEFLASCSMILYCSRNVVTVNEYGKMRYAVHVAGLVMRDFHSGLLEGKKGP